MLELSENNLRGTIPPTLGDLAGLRELHIFGNKLTGMLRESLLQRWRTGELFVAAESSLLTDVSEIDYEFSPSALLCSRHRIILLADGTAVQLTEKCRNRTPDDRTTYCEVKHGEIWAGEFPKLASLFERNGFVEFRRHYDRNVTDGAFESIRVIRGKERDEIIDYAEGGPLELWAIHRAIEGLASTAEWKKTETQARCPRWEETPIPYRHH